MNNSEITDVIPISDRRTKLTTRKLNKAPGARVVDYSGPRGIPHIRRDNLRALVKKYTPGVVAMKGGWKSTSFVSQMTGDSNPITEGTARRIETALGLPEGYMDVDHSLPQTAQVAFGMPNTPAVKTNDYTPPIDAILLADVMQRVADVSAEMGVTSTPARQAWLVTTVFADALDHDGVVRDNFIRQLVRAPV